MTEIIYEDRMGPLENDVNWRIANYVGLRYGMNYHAAMYTPEGRRAAAAVFWKDYFDSEVEL